MNSTIKHNAKHYALGAAAAYVFAVGSALLIFALGSRESTREYRFLFTFSIPPALCVMLCARLVRGGVIARSALSLLLGILVAIVWTFIADILTGGYLRAADFPVFWCWSVGGVIGLLIAALPWTARGATAGITTIGLIAASTGALFWRVSQPYRVVDVVLAPSATNEEVERVWTTARGPWDQTKGRYVFDVLEDVGRTTIDSAPAIHLRMRTFASDADSAALEARLKQPNLVRRIKWYREPR